LPIVNIALLAVWTLVFGVAVFAGGVLQMLLLVGVWPLGRFRAERAALGAAYGALSQYATGLRRRARRASTYPPCGR
jgi:hypothetical protein